MDPLEVPSNGRRETELERWDRNLVELLQEVRVAQTGVQVLFGFLLAIVFSARFHTMTSFQRADYFVTLLAAGGAAVMLIAPTSYHRILFRLGDKEHLVMTANRLTMIGLAGVAVAMVGVVMLVTDVMFSTPVVVVVTVAAVVVCAATWYLMPYRRRRELLRSAPAEREPVELSSRRGAAGSGRLRSGSGAPTRP